MDLGSRWRSLRTQLSLPNAVIAVAVLGIVVFALVDGVKRGYLHATTIVLFACFIPAVILHEISHGVVAYWRGDDTAKVLGRLSLNPLRHIDPIGSIILPILLTLAGSVPFGWAKPVPVSVNRLKHPRNDAVLVGLVGPLTNVILSLIAGVALHFLITSGAAFGTFDTSRGLSLWGEIAFDFGVVNVVLAAFNVIPIPPLDGSAVVERLLPARLIPQYYQLRFFFIIIVMFLVLTRASFLQVWFNDAENWWFSFVKAL